jgi:hypothetical protein
MNNIVRYIEDQALIPTGSTHIVSEPHHYLVPIEGDELIRQLERRDKKIKQFFQTAVNYEYDSKRLKQELAQQDVDHAKEMVALKDSYGFWTGLLFMLMLSIIVIQAVL